MLTKKLENWFEMWIISYGTWPLGWISEAHPEQQDDAVRIMQYAIDRGMNYIDTAELYGCWESEKFLGLAIQKYQREQLFIGSKVRGSNASYKAIKKACENSLKRVGTSYFDLYYIHWREDQFDLQDCMRALEELVDEGKIHNIWVSNFSHETLQLAQSYCKKYKIVANQVHYNLLFREPENTGLLQYCQENDVMLVAYRSVELWKLAHNPTLHYMGLAKKYAATSAQLSLNWLFTQMNVVTVFHSAHKEHIEENLWALNFKMSAEDIAFLRNDLKGQIPKSDCINLA